MLIRTTKALADEDDQFDYRHSYYGEDDQRMTINTDSVYANVGLNSHFALTGNYVDDAITGATPTGAPAYSQWPHQTYAGYYNQAYSGLFQQAVQDNYSLYTDGYFPSYQAFTNYVAANNPQIPGQAATTATNNYNNLVNNPNFKKNSVELINLHDHRRAFSIGAPITFGINQFTPQVSIRSGPHSLDQKTQKLS